MILTSGARDAILSALIAGGGPFDAAILQIGVATGIVNNGLAEVNADLTLPPGGMATKQALTSWGTPYTMGDGRRVVDAPAKEFRPASSAEACVIVGWYLSTASLVLKAYAYTDAPIALPDQTRAMTVIVRLTVDPAGRWDASVIVDG